MDKTGKINVFGTRFSECGKNHYNSWTKREKLIYSAHVFQSVVKITNKLEDCSLQTAYDISIMGFAIKSKMFRHCIERSGVRSI